MSSRVDERARSAADGSAAGATAVHPARTREDRWAWRRRIRSNPHQLRLYRCAVAALGLLLVLLGLATGWLPGPGGIPLVLLGLAVWASEFHWAHRLMLRLKHALHVVRGWSRRRKAAFVSGLVVACLLAFWACLAVLGPPTWLPVQVDRVLALLPGVDVPA